MVKHISVVSVELIDLDDVDVYDIEVDIDHSFIVAGVIAHNCPTCGVRDGKRWTTASKSIGHSIPYTMPPQHFRCRCSMIPVLKTWEELGINMDELPDGTRASMEGQVNDKTFADWLKRKESETPGFADKTLGKGRAELFRDGKLTMDQMISGGKPLTLAELKGKYGAPIISNMKNDIFNAAKKGGDYSKFYENYKGRYTKNLNKASSSYDKVVEEHKAWINDPSIKLGNNPPIEAVKQNTIKWHEDIRRNLAYKSIVDGILEDRRNDKSS